MDSDTPGDGATYLPPSRLTPLRSFVGGFGLIKQMPDGRVLIVLDPTVGYGAMPAGDMSFVGWCCHHGQMSFSIELTDERLCGSPDDSFGTTQQPTCQDDSSVIEAIRKNVKPAIDRLTGPERPPPSSG